MSSIDKLGELFNKRNNKETINITTGKILAISPIKVQWGDSIFLQSDRLVIANTIKDSLEVGNTVIMIPNNEYSKWYLIDKVG